jgi:Protein of unknown function (DUF4065)
VPKTGEQAVPQTNKLEELILYLSKRMEEDHHAGRGRIKLAKLLYRIDFEAFARWGKPVTEATYHADELGPAPVEELLATRDLEASGQLEWRTEWDKEKLPVARSANVEIFAHHERALIDETLDHYRLISAREMVQQAHRFPGWLVAWRDGSGEGEPVPFESIFWDPSRPPGTAAEPWENEHARALADRFAG